MPPRSQVRDSAPSFTACDSTPAERSEICNLRRHLKLHRTRSAAHVTPQAPPTTPDLLPNRYNSGNRKDP
ncbi:hypothetical protein IC582_021417 [Cucumis melo]